MKKILFGILITILGILPIFLAGNITAAQADDSEKTQTQPDKQVNEFTAWEMWIDLTCLTWMCKWAFDFRKVLWIEETQPDGITGKSIVQDVIFAATYLVWTILTIVIIYCWLMYIFSARSGKVDSKYKTWLINAWIWALLVRWWYAIVRLIQYIARW